MTTLTRSCNCSWLDALMTSSWSKMHKLEGLDTRKISVWCWSRVCTSCVLWSFFTHRRWCTVKPPVRTNGFSLELIPSSLKAFVIRLFVQAHSRKLYPYLVAGIAQDPEFFILSRCFHKWPFSQSLLMFAPWKQLPKLVALSKHYIVH